MKILFDQGTPVPLRRRLHPDRVDTAAERGWSRLENGDLIQKAEDEGYEALVTTDQNIRCQQNLSGRRIRLLVLMTTSWPKIQPKADSVRELLERMDPGTYMEFEC
jgi:hypothetical protein